jgi:hypothetical protein
MWILVCDARSSARWAIVSLLLALFCSGGTSEAVADFPAAVSEQNRERELAAAPLGDIRAQVSYWSAHCVQFEKNAVASQCWRDAAGVIDRYATTHPLSDDLRALRMDWRLRALLLSLTAPQAGEGSIEGRPQRSLREPTVKAAKAKVETPLRKGRKEKVGKPVPVPPGLAALSQRASTMKKQNFTSSYLYKE